MCTPETQEFTTPIIIGLLSSVCGPYGDWNIQHVFCYGTYNFNQLEQC